MEMPGRKWQGTSEKFRYSHNDQEREEEIFSGANSAEYWMYDSRIGRRWEPDPVVKAIESPYVTFGDNPIIFVDRNGNDWFYYQAFGESAPAWHWHPGSEIGIITHKNTKGKVKYTTGLIFLLSRQFLFSKQRCQKN